MFSFFKKNRADDPVDLSWLGTDMHSHLVPGIDDGSQDMETTIELAKGFAALGYKKIITTPHVLWEMYPNTPAIITEGCSNVKEELRRQGVELEMGAAAEYYMDDHFAELLKAKEPLLTLRDNLVLVEFSMITAPFDLKEVLFELQMQNYQPVIAHPERYIYLRHNKDLFDELKGDGCLFQVNLLSLTGHYGTSIQELAEYLVKKEYYDYAGTDMHSVRHLEGLKKLGSSHPFQKLKDSGRLQNHLL